jgi:hypothetical protein
MLAVSAPAAEPLPAARGPVILTVAGEVGRANRGPFEWQDDLLFKHHDRSFAAAAEFDLSMLEKLGMHEVTLRYPGWPRPYRLAGPWLKDVLAAAGAKPRNLTVLALDGFAKEISAGELARHRWLVAVKRDGQYLRLGGHGPAWLVYALPDDRPATDDDETNWPWAAFLIEVR